MNQFLYETHAHTAEVSPCGAMAAREVAQTYRRIGFSGVVITDHMHKGSMRKVLRQPWHAQANYFLEGYRRAKAVEDAHFRVFLGMEIRFLDSDNDYLLFGIDEDFVRNTPDLHSYASLEDFRPVVDANELLLFQAHPFRHEMQIADYHLLDGMEVYNGNSSHNSSNEIAAMWAKTYRLRPSSGSDFHGFHGMHPGGIVTRAPLATNAEFLEALREEQYTLL